MFEEGWRRGSPATALRAWGCSFEEGRVQKDRQPVFFRNNISFSIPERNPQRKLGYRHGGLHCVESMGKQQVNRTIYRRGDVSELEMWVHK